MNESKLIENAVKTMDLLHRLLLLGFALCLVYMFAPKQIETASIALPFSTIQVPYVTVKWVCAVAIFCMGFFGGSLIANLQKTFLLLKEEASRQVVTTYPSIATLGVGGIRWFCDFFLAIIPYSIGYDLLISVFGAIPNLAGGLSWLYIGPFLYFGARLSRWHEECESKKP